MTNYNERLDKIIADVYHDAKWGTGGKPKDVIDIAKQAITPLIKELVAEVIGEDEWSGIFPAIGEPSAMRDDLTEAAKWLCEQEQTVN